MWKTYRRNESECVLETLICDPLYFGAGAQHSPVPVACNGAEEERMR